MSRQNKKKNLGKKCTVYWDGKELQVSGGHHELGVDWIHLVAGQVKENGVVRYEIIRDITQPISHTIEVIEQ